MHSWKIIGRDKVIYDSYDDVKEPGEAQLVRSMFPPPAKEAKVPLLPPSCTPPAHLLHLPSI